MKSSILWLFIFLSSVTWGNQISKASEKIRTEIIVRKSLIERYDDSIFKINRDIDVNHRSIDTINFQLNKFATFYLNQQDSHKKILKEKSKHWIDKQNSSKQDLIKANLELDKIIVEIKKMKELELVKIKKISETIESELNKIKESPAKSKRIDIAMYHFAFDKKCKIDRKNKGFDFSCPHNQILKSVKNGRLSHFGTLANLGNILVIDHNDNLRSVFLGEIQSSLTINSSIKTNQQVGISLLGRYYFELRKNNKVITNISWTKE